MSAPPAEQPAVAPATQPFSLFNPDLPEQEQLNRFQTLITGSENSKPPSAETLGMLPDKTYIGTERNIARLLPGPLAAQPDDKQRTLEAYIELARWRTAGNEHMYWEDQQKRIAAAHPAVADPRLVNFVVPRVQTSDSEFPFLCHQVILSDPEDCARIARYHTKKQPNFTPFLFQSVIATTSNEHWMTQRSHLNDVFLPEASLAKIFPTSLARAKACTDKLEQLRLAAGEYGVQMHDFFLHEAQAQLQMALFGMDEEFMERTNKPIRDAFAGINPDPDYAKDMCLEMMAKVGTDPRFATVSDAEVQGGSKPIFGPLSKSVDNAAKELGLNLKDQFGNMMLILFAGHDTTAHTMTWLAFELSRHPEHQAELHREVDALFGELAGRDMVYDDCEKLPFLTRCVMETLRLWPAVGAGTYRELQCDDEVKGPDGTPVKLPKGTFVQVATWLRHRSTSLWGPDANKFNPHREFRDNEIWGGEGFKGYSPASPRFSPFTFSPRDCLGKNFAQMEMRTILANLFHKYSFTASAPYAGWDEARDGALGVFGGTMGPRDVTPSGLAESAARVATRRRPVNGMYIHPIPRLPGSSLVHKASL